MTMYTEGYAVDIRCNVCDQIFENPSLLWPCGHTFCRRCIERTMRQGEIYVCADCNGASREGYTDNALIFSLCDRWSFKQRSVQEPQQTVDNLVLLLKRMAEREAIIGELATVFTVLKIALGTWPRVLL